MKSRFVILMVVVIMLMFAGNVLAQNAFAWTDSLAVSISVTDITFAERWTSAILWFEGCDGWISYYLSEADSVGWKHNTEGKKWMKLVEGTKLSITKNKDLSIPGLKGTKFYGTTAGALFITGTKKVYR